MPTVQGIAQTALVQLNHTIGTFGSKLMGYLHGPATDDLVTFGPFCARVVLENGCAALLARLDAFRIMYLAEFQAQEEYKLEKRAKTAFSWLGDVMADGKAPASLWDIDHEVTKISRALFSGHMDHIFWRKAIEETVDFALKRGSDPMLAELTQMEPERFISTKRGVSAQLYSTLSKGVHWEFFNSLLVLDEATVKQTIREACVVVADLGLVSHFIPTAYASMDKALAVETYIEFRRTLQ